MSEIAIRTEGLSKLYTLGSLQRGFDRIGDQIVHWIGSPLRKAGQLLGVTKKPSESTFWALEDVNLEIKQGNAVGIIGQNGAGKSTLLKILSRITEPTRGFADIEGRVSSLLEVGTGFHPELTGRENIYLNGAILGMRKVEIRRKFDAIVAFAELDSFIDTPVKHYSSGMYVRLAFSVAAHLEPEILLVDEILAVGDMAFQKKCFGKMDSASKQGRTIVFVSHNMNAIQRLCPKSILLTHGRVTASGPTSEVIERYLSSGRTSAGPGEWIDLSGASRQGTGKVRFEAVRYRSFNPAVADYPFPNGTLEFSLSLFSDQARPVDSVAVILYDKYGTKLVNVDTLSLGKPIPLRQGANLIRLKVDELYLNPGIYSLGFWVADPPGEVYDFLAAAVPIQVVELESHKIRVQNDGVVPCAFELQEIG